MRGIWHNNCEATEAEAAVGNAEAEAVTLIGLIDHPTYSKPGAKAEAVKLRL
jgi:hypothetical protein